MRTLHKTDGSPCREHFSRLLLLRSYFSELYKNQVNWAPTSLLPGYEIPKAKYRLSALQIYTQVLKNFNVKYWTQAL